MKKLTKILLINIFAFSILTTQSLAKNGTVTANTSVVLRDKASKDGEAITSIVKDSTVEIIGEDGDWYQIKYDGHTGYASKKYIKEETTEKSTNTTTNTTTTNTTNNQEDESVEPENVVVASTYLRSIPSLMGNPITTVDAGKTITIVEKIGKWVKVENDGHTGWIPERKIGKASDVPKDEVVEENNEDKNTNTTNTVQETNTVTNTTANTTNTTNTVAETNTTNTTNTEKEKTDSAKENTSSSTNNAGKKAVVQSNTVNVRNTPKIEEDNIAGAIYKGDVITIEGEEGDWYKFSNSDFSGKYVSKDYVKISDSATVSSRSSSERDDSLISAEANAAVNTALSSGTGSQVVAKAKEYLGYPYVAAGKSPSTGFDCSGFTSYVYSQFGYSIGASSASQASAGVEVARNSLAPGDIVLFYDEGYTKIGHAGIYIGDNSFIHAANPKRGVVIEALEGNSYYSPRYVTARRIVN